ncbi:hypothetical protein [Streptomyces sp. NPDC088727]|uniref:hypothetical protein n=1 Tax=Streptomyces sp. NPDC088727 TaxID=3365875 RepID=UPI003826E234
MSHDAGTPTSTGTTTRVERLAASPRPHPRALAPGNLIRTVVLSLFSTPAFPADAPWSPGIAAVEAVKAGDGGGRRAKVFGAGPPPFRPAPQRTFGQPPQRRREGT